MQDNYQKKLLINLILSAGLIVLLLIFHYFVNADIGEKIELVKNLTRDSTLRTRAVESLVTLKEDSKRAAPYLESLNNILPASDKLINFRSDIRSRALQNKIDLGFTFGTESPGSDAKAGSIAFQMTASGQVQNFINFLRSIETSNYIVSFASLEVKQTANTVNATLSGKIFSR